MINVAVTDIKESQETNSGEEDLIFYSFEELFLWLEKINGVPIISPGVLLYELAKDGRTGLRTRKEHIEINSDSRDYPLARGVAFEAGLIKKRGFGEVYVRNPQAGLAFARTLDSRFSVSQS
ncbi:MAG: hypothetical protein BZY87_07370 [SAR202 cluster bacterium Io17-Chloro-G6]|nr:MAG: hypothetical protein BZY87_07370 [SAR202 cluster bacterium Io17-Chloro-G6]